MPYKKYIADDKMEILGAALIPILENRNVYEFVDLVRDYGFDDIDPEKWYSFQWELDFMKALSERMNSVNNMYAIGIEIFDTLVLPPEIETVEQGVQMLNDIVHLNMRHIPKDLGYIIKKVDNNYVELVENTPFPHNLVHGYLHGLCKKLLPSGHSLEIKRDYLSKDDPDSAGAIYRITW